MTQKIEGINEESIEHKEVNKTIYIAIGIVATAIIVSVVTAFLIGLQHQVMI